MDEERELPALGDTVLSLLFALVAMLVLSTGCAGGYSYSYRTGPQPYGYQGQYAQAQGFSAQGQGVCYNGVYSCPSQGVVMYQPGYQGPAPQYGPYGYSAAMTSRVTPHVYVMPSPRGSR